MIREVGAEYISQKPDPKTFHKKESLPLRILALLTDDPYLTQEELCDQLGVSLRTIKRAMKTLQDDGRLVRNGNRRSGSWIVVR